MEARAALDETGASAGLTRGEFDILARLIAAEPAAGRDGATAAIGRRAEADALSVDVLVSRLRRKLGAARAEAELIVTVAGYGYQLGRPAAEA